MVLHFNFMFQGFICLFSDLLCSMINRSVFSKKKTSQRILFIRQLLKRLSLPERNITIKYLIDSITSHFTFVFILWLSFIFLSFSKSAWYIHSFLWVGLSHQSLFTKNHLFPKISLLHTTVELRLQRVSSIRKEITIKTRWRESLGRQHKYSHLCS